MVQEVNLSNGLKVVSEFNPNVESISLGVWVKVGTRHEDAEINGIAHMLEHMAFKGTATRSAQQIAQEVEYVGGDINAYTSMEATAYHIRILKDHMPLAMDIIADILQNSVFDPEEFLKEREVILQEIGQAYDTPDDIIFDYFQHHCFPGQSLGRPILGSAQVIKNLNPGQVKGFMDAHYGAKQMILSAAGYVDQDQLLDLAHEKFDGLHQDLYRPWEEGQYIGGEARYQRDLEQVHVLLGFEGVAYRDPDYYTAAILSAILGGGMSSRLFQEVREKRSLAYTVYSFSSSYTDSGIFGIYSATKPEQVTTLIPVLMEEMQNLTANIAIDELEKAKNQLKSSLLMGLESSMSRCRFLANQFLIHGRHFSNAEIVEKINHVHIENLVELAKRLLQSNPTLVTLGNVKALPSNLL